MSCENREAQIPDFFKKSGILLLTTDLGLLYMSVVVRPYCLDFTQLSRKIDGNTFRLKFFDRSQRRGLPPSLQESSFVETAIYRVWCLNS